ncbi:MAG TPA: ATP-dependent DNA helicase [Kofleriaceae bacterium]|nr:ATP-dependent DNA helicase [Kofleriaceae bacterium]
MSEETLGPGGALSAAIPHFEDRPEQRRMADAVTAALADDRPLLVEAGTGTGKTLAYLVPALSSGKRVIVSTGTRALQDQIVRHDLPLLRQIIGRPFVAVALKGVSNYVCKRKLDEVRRTPAAKAGPLAQILDWIDETTTGDRAELETVGEDAPVWAEVTTTPDTRIGPRCPHFERCFVTGARRAADKADLVLVNHHLYFADLALRTAFPGARVLPDHDAVIFDEAHQLEDVATEHFGVRLSTMKMASLVRDAMVVLGATLFDVNRGHDTLVTAVERASVALFAHARKALLHASPDGGRVPLPPALLNGPGQDAWFALDNALEEMARTCDLDALPPPPSGPGDPEEDEQDVARREQLNGLARRARAVRDDLAELAEQRQRAHVYWGETRATGTTLAAAPISVADVLRRVIVHGSPTAVFTSATITVAGEFDYTRTRLGLDRTEVDELGVASPFDYRRQAMLYLARDLPVPTGEGLPAPVAARIVELLAITSGRAFVLFTSHRALADAARLLANLPYPLLRQGDAPRAALVDRFRATPGAVLLGTGSFWEGVDVPGDALSLVIIDKLPFAPHTDPLIAARAAALTERGIDPFAALQLPQAALALKQGFGRLIRRRDDRGIVAILDPRIVTKNYGRVLVESLPPGMPRTSAIEQVRRWWRTVDVQSGDVDALVGDRSAQLS